MRTRSSRHVAYPQRRYRRQLRSFIRANAGPLAVVAISVVGLGVLMSIIGDGYVVGLVHGILAVGYVSVVLTSFHLVSGSHRQLAGKWGEDNTRDALRKAKRRNLVSGWVDNLEIASGDVDHLVVLRSGALVAIDSKWTVDWDATNCRQQVTAAQAAAVRARNILRHLGVSRPVVHPVIAVWGGGQSDLPARWVDVEGTPVIQGRSLHEWIARVGSTLPVGDDQPRHLVRDLRRFRREVSASSALASDAASAERSKTSTRVRQ